MGKLIYAANTSLDGFLEDETGSFDWSVPDEEMNLTRFHVRAIHTATPLARLRYRPRHRRQDRETR